MNRSQLEAAIDSGRPFSLRMADGMVYEVPHPDYVSLPPKGTFAIVYDDQEKFHVLPLITMTGIESSMADSDTGS